MHSTDRQQLIIVLSGPSGSGKTTVAQTLCQREPGLYRTISATTRPPRPTEIHGRDYHFLSEQAFSAKLAAGEFIEHATYGGYRYGTLESEVEKARQLGKDVLLEIDVQGAAQILRCYPEAVTIWVLPPSWEALESRLRQRHTESEEKIQMRLARAREEIRSVGLYRYIVTNEDGKLDEAVSQIRCILVAERCRPSAARLQAILHEFTGT